MRRMCAWVVVVSAAGLAAGVELRAQETEGAAAVLPWAYVLNDPDVVAEALDPDEVVTVPGSSVSMPRSAIAIDNGPPDWHPDGHPPMPEVVARGGGEGVVACGYCHLPNGQGKPENAGLAGPALRVPRAADDRLAERPASARRAAHGAARVHGAHRAGRHRRGGAHRRRVLLVDRLQAVGPRRRDRRGAGDPVRGMDTRGGRGRLRRAHRHAHRRDPRGPEADQAARRLVGLHRLRAVGRGGAGPPPRAHRRRQLRGVAPSATAPICAASARCRPSPAARRRTWRGSFTT